jgi:hypothetical protein
MARNAESACHRASGGHPAAGGPGALPGLRPWVGRCAMLLHAPGAATTPGSRLRPSGAQRRGKMLVLRHSAGTLSSSRLSAGGLPGLRAPLEGRVQLPLGLHHAGSALRGRRACDCRSQPGSQTVERVTLLTPQRLRDDGGVLPLEYPGHRRGPEEAGERREAEACKGYIFIAIATLLIQTSMREEWCSRS